MAARACLLALLAGLAVAGPPPQEISDPRLVEISGIAPSHRHPGCHWVHNDSGNPAIVYLLAPDGTVAAEVQLDGVRNRDWEDIAVVPTATGADVCVGEIGDNKGRWSRVAIYRFPEPDLPEPGGRVRLRPQRYELRYEDGPRNAEALAVDPRSGAALIFTKRTDGITHVYRLAAPWDPGSVNLLTRMQTLRLDLAGPPGSITAADFHPDGTRLVLRNYMSAWEYRIDRPRPTTRPARLPGEQTAPQVQPLQLTGPPRQIHLPTERQGEAVAYTTDGSALLTISEKLPTYLYQLPLRSGD